MRFALTPSEAILWSRLRARQLGVQFRRQYVIGRFIVDFAAPSERLVVEVDGGYHERRSGSVARREAALRRAGWRVLRLPAALVEQRLEDAVAPVEEALGP